MMIFNDFSKVSKRIALKKGAVLLSKEHCSKVMFILHEGSVHVKHPEHDGVKLDDFPIFTVSPDNYFGFESYLEKSFYIPTFVCAEDCVISVYPFESLKKLAYTSTDAFCVIIKRMISIFSSFVSVNNKLAEKNQALDEYKEKLALMIKKLKLPVTSHVYFEAIEDVQEFEELNEDPDALLKPINFVKRNPDRIYPYKIFFARDIYTVSELFSAKTRKETIVLIQRNPKIGELIFESLKFEYDFIYRFIYKNTEALHKEMSDLIFDKGSLINILREEQQLIPKDVLQKSVIPIFAFLQDDVVQKSFIVDVYKDVNFDDFFVLKAALDDVMDEAIPVGEKEFTHAGLREEDEQIEAEAVLEEMDIEAGQLAIPADVKSFLKKEKTYADEREVRKVLKNVNVFFLNSVEHAVRKITGLGEGDERLDVDINSFSNTWEYILLETGVLNPKMVGARLYRQLLGFSDENDTKIYSFFNLREWLTKIVEEEVQPSNNEMGFSYRKHILNEMRTWSTKKKDIYKQKPPLEIVKDKLNFEVHNMVHIVYRIMNKSPFHSVFPLAKVNFEASVFDTAITSEKIEEVLEEIRSVDFSLFYRETLFRVSETKNLIIQKEVMPNFIIFPGVGHRVVFWQDIEETKKSTPARIIVPRYFLGNLKSAVVHALGSFRWEICKSVKGAGWTDPIDGGLTGAFTDYITFYRKNINISIESKQKISDLIKNYRNNFKAIFCAKYHDWIEYEQRGIMRLISIERDFFFKFLPFSNAICKRLEKIPTYEKLIFRTRNLAAKKISSSENSFRKTMDDEGNYPEGVQKYMKFLKM